MSASLIKPDWSAPANVKACITTRQLAGVSQSPYDAYNLATHVGDSAEAVATNRQRLSDICRQYNLALPSAPVWLNQTHSTQVVDAATHLSDTGEIPEADASFSTRPGVVCTVMTADCLPLLVTNRQGTGVAAIHAGWRGLQAGIIESTVKQLMRETETQPQDIGVYLGPAIGPQAFEVGPEVKDAFVEHDRQAEIAFKPSPRADHYLADIYQLAIQRLGILGIDNISGGDYCTYSDAERFYSYRRDGRTGRMASLIWLEH